MYYLTLIKSVGYCKFFFTLFKLNRKSSIFFNNITQVLGFFSYGYIYLDLVFFLTFLCSYIFMQKNTLFFLDLNLKNKNYFLFFCKKYGQHLKWRFLKFIIIGFGYRLLENQTNNLLGFKLGFKLKIKLQLPNECQWFKIKKTKFVVKSIFYNLLYHYALLIKKIRFPLPYKKKGIFFVYDLKHLKLKEGKKQRF